MQKKTVIRIILDFVIFGFSALGLWWIVFPIGTFGITYYRRYYEYVFAGFFIDVIYSTTRSHLFGFKYIFTLVAVMVFLIVMSLKKRMRKEIWQKNF